VSARGHRGSRGPGTASRRAAVYSLLLGIACCASPRTASSRADRPALIPQPREQVRQPGSLRIADRYQVVSDSPGEDDYALDLLRGLPRSDTVRSPRPGRDVRLRLVRLRRGDPGGVPADAVAAESYSLTIRGDSAVVTGPTAASRLHGAETLVELARSSAGRLPMGRIVDGPSLSLRGLSLDVSRGRMPTVPEFTAILDVCARFKLNQLQLYFENSFDYRGIPRDALQPWALSPAALRAVSRAAERRHIQLVPIVQTLDHQAGMLSHASMREYSEGGATLSGLPGLTRRIARGWRDLLARAGWPAGDDLPASGSFAITTPRAQRLVEGMVRDVLEASGGSAVHIGCDEADEIGKGASARVAQLRGDGSIYLEHVTRLADCVRSVKGGETWVYDDFLLAHAELLPALPSSLVLVDWHYDPLARFTSLDSLKAIAPGRIVTSPGLWNWYSVYPDYARALPNIRAAIEAARSHGCRGSVLASWGDGGSEDLFGNDLFGIAYFADAAWTGEPDRPPGFVARYSRARFGPEVGDVSPVLTTLTDLRIPNVGHNLGLIYHPLVVRTRTASWIGAVRALDGRLRDARKALAGVRSTDVYGTGEVRALECTLDRLLAATRREIALDDAASRIASVGATPATNAARSEALRRASSLEARAAIAYAREWRTHNEMSGLPEVLKRMDRNAAALDSLAGAADAGLLAVPERFQR
jgi:hypothetical protein